MATHSPFLAGILGLGPGELVLILLILLVLFGGSKLPGLSKGLGQSIKEFKKASRDDDPAETTTEKKSEPSKTPGAN